MKIVDAVKSAWNRCFSSVDPSYVETISSVHFPNERRSEPRAPSGLVDPPKSWPAQPEATHIAPRISKRDIRKEEDTIWQTTAQPESGFFHIPIEADVEEQRVFNFIQPKEEE